MRLRLYNSGQAGSRWYLHSIGKSKPDISREKQACQRFYLVFNVPDIVSAIPLMPHLF
jgi:hypothetical protein